MSGPLWPVVAAELLDGHEVTLRPHGNSMAPLIRSGERIVLSPCEPEDVSKGDIVLAKVKGRWFCHKVKAIGSDGRFQISNNRGRVNGWTRKVYGRVTQIGEEK